MAAATVGRSTATVAAGVGFSLIGLHHLKPDFLERKLLTNTLDQSPCLLRRLVDSAELNFNRLPGQVRKRISHFPVEKKGQIRVHFFLQLK